MRPAFNIAIVFSILFAPWWATAVILACACLMIDRFYEAIIYGIVIDALYGTSVGVRGFGYAATLFSVVVFLIATAVRSKLAWNGSERL